MLKLKPFSYTHLRKQTKTIKFRPFVLETRLVRTYTVRVEIRSERVSKGRGISKNIYSVGGWRHAKHMENDESLSMYGVFFISNRNGEGVAI